MITGFFRNFKTITPELYEHVINTLDLFNVSCSCGHAGCLIRHGYYTRKLKTRSATITLRILRVKCRECGRTHAILPDLVVPYSQLPADIQQLMLLQPLGSTPLDELMVGNSDITESDALRVRSNFRHHWEQRLKSVSAVLDCIIQQLTELCCTVFRRQFMQIRRGVYLLTKGTHIA